MSVTRIFQVKVWSVDCENTLETSYLAFQTFDSIGVMKLPGTGHPNEYDIILAHPNGVRTLDVTSGHNLLISCGEKDHCIFLWKFNIDCMENRGKDQTLQMNEEIKQLQSLFYYIQLQDPSHLSIAETIPLPLMTDFARACAIPISERQIQELYDEECFKKKFSDPQKIQINFEEAIRIYYNHFAHNTNQTSTDDLIHSIFNQYKSPITSTINIHSLVQNLVS